MPKADLPKWYYDACALDRAEVLSEITKKNRPNTVIISHLALGEAYGVSFNKSHDRANAFVELINNLRNYIRIIGNDGIKDMLREVMDAFPALETADAIHLATALRYNCEAIRTADRDMYGIPAKTLAEFAKSQNKGPFYITQVK